MIGDDAKRGGHRDGGRFNGLLGKGAMLLNFMYTDIRYLKI